MQSANGGQVGNGLPRAVAAAVEHGWSVLPVNLGKRPLLEEWGPLQTDRPTLEQVQQWQAEFHPAGWAVLTGQISGVDVIDFDGAEGKETMERHGIHPHVRTGSGGAHQYVKHPGFRIPTLNGKTKAALREIAPGVDIRGDGGYAVFHGRNASGPYRRLRPLSEPDPWAGELVDKLMALMREDQVRPAACEQAAGTAASAGRVPAEEILAKFLARERNGAGRNDTGLDLACQLRDNGYTEQEAAVVMAQYAASVRNTNTKGNPEPYGEKEWRATLRSAYRRPAREPWVQPGPAGRAAGATESTAEAGEQQEHGQARAEADWPQPEQLGGALPPVMAFDERLLPASLRPAVLDTAERMQVPIDLPAAVAVGCLAGTVNRRAMIQPKDGDPTWVVIANLWVALIALSGFMKSPILQAFIRLLAAIEADWRRDYVEPMKDYTRAKEEFDLRNTAWKEAFKAATKKGRITPARPPGEPPEEPTLRRLIVNDATFEALHQTMADNPAGVLAVRDELTGWWAQLDKPGREGERAFCLQAWNGNTGHTVDRIGRGTIYAPACCMSMIGGIQPARLRSYLVDALKDGPGNDGLVQRFQVMVWPDAERTWRRVNRPANQGAQQRAEKVFRRLVELDADQPVRFLFDPDGQELFWTWLEELELKVRGDELHPALISHLSKYRSLMPSLALLFCLADQADQVSSEFPQRDSDGTLRIPLQSTRQAAAFCEYLESHARRIYSCVVSPQMRAAHELAARIKRREVGTDRIFSCREVYRKGWAGLDSPELVERAVEALQDVAWIRPVAAEPKPAGGRAPARFAINPRIWE
jgi:hypothetical protein